MCHLISAIVRYALAQTQDPYYTILTRALPVKQSPVSQSLHPLDWLIRIPHSISGLALSTLTSSLDRAIFFIIFLVYKDSNPRVYSRPPPLLPGLEDKIEGQRLITTNCNDILSYRSTRSRMIIGGNVSRSYIERSHLYMQGASGVM